MVITTVTVNTGSMHFYTVKELSVFLSTFSITQKTRELITQLKTTNAVITTKTDLISSNNWVETIVSTEDLKMELKTERDALYESLGWTCERSVSHTYD
jgi:hypothetical protein